MRGLDYYNLTVFEFVTDLLGAQGTICAGGRYDYLIEQIGGKPAPAVGWALGGGARAGAGQRAGHRHPHAQPDAYAIVPDAAAMPQVLTTLTALREAGCACKCTPPPSKAWAA